MSDMAVEFSPKQYQAIGEYVQIHINEWIAEDHRKTDRDQRERIIRVEESLKNIHEQMKEGFQYMEKRFEQMDRRFEHVDKRFEQVDKRFVELREDMKTQFNRVNAILAGLFITVTGGFITLIIKLISQ